MKQAMASQKNAQNTERGGRSRSNSLARMSLSGVGGITHQNQIACFSRYGIGFATLERLHDSVLRHDTALRRVGDHIDALAGFGGYVGNKIVHITKSADRLA